MTTVAGTLTILIDNTIPGKSDLLGEHGFSAYLETSEGSKRPPVKRVAFIFPQSGKGSGDGTSSTFWLGNACLARGF